MLSIITSLPEPGAATKSTGVSYKALICAAVSVTVACCNTSGARLAISTILLAKVTTPVLLIVAAPDIVTAVATFDALPTNMSPDGSVLEIPPFAATDTKASVEAS